MSKRAVVLLSGGLDSATTLALAKKAGYELFALSFRYGQRHQAELQAAGQIASAEGVAKHLTIDIDLRVFGGSALTSDIPVPKNQDPKRQEVPVTYVPARNTIFLSYALAWAEVLNCHNIFIGVNAVDYSGYPDCRPEYIQTYERMANLATKAAVEGGKLTIHAPLIELSKAEIIRQGTALGVDYSATVSCYDADADGLACGACDSCRLRAKGFAEADLPDPTRYRPA